MQLQNNFGWSDILHGAETVGSGVLHYCEANLGTCVKVGETAASMIFLQDLQRRNKLMDLQRRQQLQNNFGWSDVKSAASTVGHMAKVGAE